MPSNRSPPETAPSTPAGGDSTPRHRSPHGEEQAADAANTPVRRRSPRVEALANLPPTPAQLARIEAEEIFARNVSPRLPGATDVTSRRPRTRAVSVQIRAKHKNSPPQLAQRGGERGPREAQVDGDESKEEPSASREVAREAADDDGSSEYDDTEPGSDHVSTKAKIPLVELSDEPVPAPPILEYHASWDAWFTYELQYSEDTHQILSVVTTLSVAGRNRKIAELKKPTQEVPSELATFERVYICTHGTRPKSTGTGQRPQRFIRYTGCPMRFIVQCAFQKESGWRLRVNPRVMWHNHKVGPQVYRTYPVARGVKDPDTQQRGREMVADGVGRTRICNFFLDRGENVYKVDVDNFISQNLSADDDNTATAIILARLANKDQTSVITVDETDRHETGVISITTSHMRRMFSRFGELLLVDCTHNTNR
jgi:hypothetical protein